MAKKNFYAVKVGKIPGIYQSWESCKNSVDGYPGAEYKGFATEQEARQYLSELLSYSDTETCAKKVTSAPSSSDESEECVSSGSPGDCTAALTGADAPTGLRHDLPCAPNQVIAYVDGSFDVSVGRYSFGCILLTPDGNVTQEFGNGNNPDSLALRNVTGEMLGAMFAVQWCMKHNYTALDIRYDYSGIEMWAKGAWKANNDLTQKYAAYMQRNRQRIQITFTKIAAHTGDKYNEMADKLAKRALTEADGIPKI